MMSAPDPATRIDYAALRSGGIIMQKDDDFFAIRLRPPGGCIFADILLKIADVAKNVQNEIRLAPQIIIN